MFLGAVVRKVDSSTSDPESFDTLEIFVTGPPLRFKVKDVLQASSAAPTYFPSVSIGFSKYIDGGVGGNCPLLKAIPKAKELYPKSQLVSTLSIAPSRKIGKFHKTIFDF